MAKADLLKQVKEKLSLEQLQATGRGGGGCISQGQAFLTENGKVFVKFNSKPGVRHSGSVNNGLRLFTNCHFL